MDHEESGLFAFTGTPGRLERRIAAGAAAIILVLLLAAAPFAKITMLEEPAFTGAYAAWFALAETVITILLFALFLSQRAPGLFVLAVGSLLMPLGLILYISTHVFPAPKPSGSTGLATLWGSGYPIFVLAYSALGGAKGNGREADWRLSRWGPGAQLVAFAIIAMVISGGLSVTLAPASGWLLAPVGGDRWPPVYHVICFALAGLSASSLVALAVQRSRSVLDLWLMIEMTAFTAALVLNGLSGAQYDFGWYAGRAFGLVASSTLLLALLIESAAHYGRVAELNEALVVSNRALEHLSLHDGMTGLPNRRYFDTYLSQQVLLTRRRQHQRGLALVLIDVDSFKAYNDLYGHLAGDECLTHVAIALKSCCRRPADMAARYGGEEFALILPDTDLASAIAIGEAAREAVLKLALPHSGSATGSVVTISGGVATLDGRTDPTMEALVAAADEGLFVAKTGGRNQVASAPANSLLGRASA
ncbi:MAG TPA: diguanylate cyclase [Caulobacteraceae bacterium]|jgi:diguanylate cyclase (GGDEF)-like protein